MGRGGSGWCWCWCRWWCLLVMMHVAVWREGRPELNPLCSCSFALVRWTEDPAGACLTGRRVPQRHYRLRAGKDIPEKKTDLQHKQPLDHPFRFRLISQYLDIHRRGRQHDACPFSALLQARSATVIPYMHPLIHTISALRFAILPASVFGELSLPYCSTGTPARGFFRYWSDVR